MRTHTFLKILYAVLGVAILGMVLNQYNPDAKSDIGILLGYLMLIVSFPISLVVLALVGFVVLPICNWLAISLEFGYTYIVLYWAIFFSAGYFQWFILVPWLVRILKDHKYRE